jgi:hypothetical protein
LSSSSSSSSNGQDNRKGFLLKSVNSCLGLFLASTQEVAAAETIGKDPNCDDLTCLGVWDGLLAGKSRESIKHDRKACYFTDIPH